MNKKPDPNPDLVPPLTDAEVELAVSRELILPPSMWKATLDARTAERDRLVRALEAAWPTGPLTTDEVALWSTAKAMVHPTANEKFHAPGAAVLLVLRTLAAERAARERAEAACAEMRDVLGSIVKTSVSGDRGLASIALASCGAQARSARDRTDLGAGWLSPEEAGRLRAEVLDRNAEVLRLQHRATEDDERWSRECRNRAAERDAARTEAAAAWRSVEASKQAIADLRTEAAALRAEVATLKAALTKATASPIGCECQADPEFALFGHRDDCSLRAALAGVKT